MQSAPEIAKDSLAGTFVYLKFMSHALGIGVETASNTLVQPDYPLILIIGGNKSQPPLLLKTENF